MSALRIYNTSSYAILRKESFDKRVQSFSLYLTFPSGDICLILYSIQWIPFVNNTNLCTFTCCVLPAPLELLLTDLSLVQKNWSPMLCHSLSLSKGTDLISISVFSQTHSVPFGSRQFRCIIPFILYFQFISYIACSWIIDELVG